MIIGIPIRSFETAKQRLAGHLTPEERRTVAELLAGHALVTAAALTDVVIVTGDAGVRRWAEQRSVEAIDDDGTLDSAATAVAIRAGAAPWGVLHADLPTLTHHDLEAALVGFAGRGTAIAPSWDGGTSLIMSSGRFAFSYGPGSFHRHVAHRPESAIIIRPGLALDVDEPEHLASMVRGRLAG